MQTDHTRLDQQLLDGLRFGCLVEVDDSIRTHQPDNEVRRSTGFGFRSGVDGFQDFQRYPMKIPFGEHELVDQTSHEVRTEHGSNEFLWSLTNDF